MKKMARFPAALLCLCLVFTACGGGGTSQGDGQGSSGPAPGGQGERDTLTVALSSEAPNLDPHNNSMIVSFAIENMIYDRLIYQTMDGEFLPMLATDWEVVDEQTIKFSLRDDVTFHNGEKFTADDVVYTVQRACEMSTSQASFSSFDGAATEKVDDYTVIIKMNTPYSAVFNTLASARGNIVCKKTMEELGSDAYGRAPIGTGKFKFINWVAGDKIELEAFDGYWGEKPSYKKLVFRTVSEAANRAIELETGGADISLDIQPGDMQRLEDNPKTKVVSGPGGTVNYLGINSVAFPELSDVRVRQALAMSLDMDALVRTAYKGGAIVADSVIPPTAFAYKKIGPWEYNPEKAKELLAEANYDGTKPIPLVIPDARDAIDAAEIVQNMWKQVGVEVEISIMDKATISSRNLNGENLMAYSSGTNVAGNADSSLVQWERPKMGFHNSDEITALLQEAKRTYDDKRRAEIYVELQEKIWDYVSVIPISFSNVIYGMASDVQNFECHPAKLPDFSKVTFGS